MQEVMEGWVILLCDAPTEDPNWDAKFWDGEDWTTDFSKAKTFSSYTKALRGMWVDFPENKLTGRIITFTKDDVRASFNGRYK